VVGFLLPHCPYIAPAELFDYYRDRVDLPMAEAAPPPTIERLRRLRGLLDPPLRDEQIRLARAAYFSLCEYLDRQIGRILRLLDETGLARRTLVIYCADHGEMAGEHGLWGKSTFYEASAGIPLIARWPGVIQPGAVSAAVVNLMDIAPTLVELGRAATPPELADLRWDGRSLVPLLRQAGDSVAWNQETLSELVDSEAGSPALPCRMVRSGDWKLWVYGDSEHLPPALFNLADDPGEIHDLGTSPAHGQVRERLLLQARDGWDPDAARAVSVEGAADQAVIAAWGRAVGPACSDTVAAPPPELEAEVELF
jgi:choline-sulfatase